MHGPTAVSRTRDLSGCCDHKCDTLTNHCTIKPVATSCYIRSYKTWRRNAIVLDSLANAALKWRQGRIIVLYWFSHSVTSRLIDVCVKPASSSHLLCSSARHTGCNFAYVRFVFSTQSFSTSNPNIDRPDAGRDARPRDDSTSGVGLTTLGKKIHGHPLRSAI